MPPLPKRYGKTLPPVINPDGRLCFKLSVPNTLEYKAALMGAVGTLGYWFTWQHTQADYSNIPERNIEAAELWTQVLSEAVWSECMEICEQIINCIVNDEDVQNALRNFVLGDEAINNYINNIASYQVLSAANRAQNLLKPDACEEGFIFNQASVLVSLLNSLSTDILQAIEVLTNGLERAEQLVSAIPAIGGLFPLDELIGLADQVAEEVYEGYEGDWDEGLYDDLRCAIFCLIKDDCEMNIDTVITFYEGKLSASLPTDPVQMFTALLEYILGGLFPEDAAVYAMHLLVLSAIRLSQEVVGVDFATMGLRIIAAGDESDNDWEIICEECGSEIWDEWDFSTGDMFDFYAAPGFATFSSGWGIDADPTQIAFKRADAGQAYDAVEIYFDQVVAGTMIASSVGNENATGFITTITTDHQMWAGGGTFTDGFFVDFVNSPTLVGERIVKMRARRA